MKHFLLILAVYSFCLCLKAQYPPENLSIIISGGNLVLNWNAVSGADSYNVYRSSKPNSADWGSPIAQVTDNEYSEPATGGQCFFRVTSVTDPIGQLVHVPGGTFSNGVSNVTLSAFWLSRHELTQAGYLAVMGYDPAIGFGEGDNHPVYYVSWFNAIEYCNRRSLQEGLNPCFSYGTFGTNPDSWPANWDTSYLNHINVSCNWTANGYRLPTEMEWMYAARGGNLSHGYNFSGGNVIGEVAWYMGNSGTSSHTVGTKDHNELGLHDLSGNVWEWCWDIYGDYPGGNQTNPKGATSGPDRTIRGGYFYSSSAYCTVESRYYSQATYSIFSIGLRVCRTVQP